MKLHVYALHMRFSTDSPVIAGIQVRQLVEVEAEVCYTFEVAAPYMRKATFAQLYAAICALRAGENGKASCSGQNAAFVASLLCMALHRP